MNWYEEKQEAKRERMLERAEKKAREGRACNNIDKGADLLKQAQKLEARAETYGTHSISSDDPEAAGKLREKIAKLERQQEIMRATNRVAQALAEAGLTSPIVARKMLEPDFAGRIGFAAYELTNNGANIRRLKQRLAAIEAKAGAETKETEIAGVKVVENRKLDPRKP